MQRIWEWVKGLPVWGKVVVGLLVVAVIGGLVGGEQAEDGAPADQAAVGGDEAPAGEAEAEESSPDEEGQARAEDRQSAQTLIDAWDDAGLELGEVRDNSDGSCGEGANCTALLTTDYVSVRVFRSAVDAAAFSGPGRQTYTIDRINVSFGGDSDFWPFDPAPYLDVVAQEFGSEPVPMEDYEPIVAVDVPDLVGADVTEATTQLEALGLIVTIEHVEVGLFDPEGVVLEQSVRGSSVEGAEIQLSAGVDPDAFEPIVLSGSGDDVLDVAVPGDVPAVIAIEHTGGGNFAVWTYNAAGARSDLLVNEIGAYSGSRLINATAGDEVAELEITAGGSWTVTIRPLRAAMRTSDGQASGTGDAVLLLDPSARTGRAELTHAGASNFAVWSYGSGRDLLVNDVGSYSGTVRVDTGAIVLDITADGPWTFTAQ